MTTARPKTVVATTHKTTAMVVTVATAVLRRNKTTSLLCHLDLPHKPLHTASSMALRPASNKVPLEADTEDIKTNEEDTPKVGTVVAAAATTQGPGKTNGEGMVRARVVGEATAAISKVGTAMEEEAMAADMEVEMVAAEAKEEGTRKSSPRIMEQ